MKPEVVLVVVIVIASLIVVVANDWWKKCLVSKAESKGKKARRDLYLNKTQWGMVLVLALAMAAYAYVLNDPLLWQKVKRPGIWGP